MTMKANRTRKVAVGAVKKSIDAISSIWFLRNVSQTQNTRSETLSFGRLAEAPEHSQLLAKGNVLGSKLRLV